jgi:hypothetical protein
METHGTGKDGDGRKRIPVCLPAAISPLARTVVRGEPCGTGILLQRFCGRFCRSERPGRYRTGVCTAESRDRGRADKPIRSLAIRAIGRMPVVPGATATSLRRLGGTAFPSLRAHVLNPAGPAVHRDLAGATIQNTILVNQLSKRITTVRAVRSCPILTSGTLLAISEHLEHLRKSQFTNRRMRTFIATPSARKVNNTEDPP